ncbi:MAG: hypothetical protein U0903_15900 [Planctomycetales bacterium]
MTSLHGHDGTIVTAVGVYEDPHKTYRIRNPLSSPACRETMRHLE